MSRDWFDLKHLYQGIEGARAAFEKVCERLLRAMNPDKMVTQVRPNPGDGGIDISVGNFGVDPIEVYQCKFFLEQLGDSQKQQIRDSFNTCIQAPKVKIASWNLCLPKVLDQKELLWWSEWRAEMLRRHDISILLYNGKKLIDLLQEHGLYDQVFQLEKKKEINELPYITATKQYLDEQINESFFSLKYTADRYVPREIEAGIENWLDKKPSSCFLLLAPAGSGKTNLFCQLATRSASIRPTLLVTGAQMNTNDPLGLWAPFYKILSGLIKLDRDRAEIIRVLKSYLGRNRQGVAYFIDAINESAEPARMSSELQNFLDEARSVGISTVISCRDHYWGYFEAGWWTLFLQRKGKKGSRPFIRRLGNYQEKEAEQAFAIYFKAHQISVDLQDNAKIQFRHPLLLRFFCETHRRKSIGKLTDIRLKDLFDQYWNEKLRSISEKMKAQGEESTTEVITAGIGDGILAIADTMLSINKRLLAAATAIEITRSENGPSYIKTPYSRILDEHIILEELSTLDAANEKMVAFVFEEFMEYSMARSIVRKWRGLDADQVKEAIRKLILDFDNFSQLFGVVLYIALMLKEQRKINLWPILIGMGDKWARVVVESLKKLAFQQKDEGVLQAIVDLLHVQDAWVLTSTLKLLRHKRFKWALSLEVQNAVYRLIDHDKSAVKIQAVFVSARFEPAFRHQCLEKAVSEGMNKSRKVVALATMQVLVKVRTDKSLYLLAQLCGRYYDKQQIIAQEAADRLEDDIAETFRFLKHSDVIVCIGAASILGHSRSREALSQLEEVYISGFTNARPFDETRHPDWTLLKDDLLKNEEKVRAEVIETAYYRLNGMMLYRTLLLTWREKIGLAVKEARIGLPHDVNTIEERLENLNLIAFIIRKGIEYRSGREWRTTRSGNESFRISDPTSRDPWMSDETVNLLFSLFGLIPSETDHLKQYGLRVNLRNDKMGYYWKDCIYRAWGEEPPL